MCQSLMASCHTESTLVAVLAVIPVQEEKRERAHDKEEEDPYPEAGIVFYCLVIEINKTSININQGKNI